ncbi:hypothetical protein [uncultured Tateyamaria sp.]|uniref:hypothetical protein n=1 Tax=uncultured Tateyamaria sp. TaxID=455651 RepID=UPI0026216AD6|nr:hypothetical protein [uncultured Tateyamaria sp.]
MKNVTQIRLAEAVHVDQDRLGALYSQMDADSAEDVVCRAMEELALRMGHCDRQYRAGDLAALHKSSKSLIAIADQIGMTVLAGVARDVATCAKTGDPVALAATIGRLMRTGEGSLSAIWELQDMTI